MNRKTEQRLITKTRKVFLLLEEALTKDKSQVHNPV